MKHGYLLAATVLLASQLVAADGFADLPPIRSSSGIGKGADKEFMQPKGKNPKTIDFVTDEATMPGMSVSPKGDSIVFDLLGHIYRMPITGGVAESLTQESGIAVNVHPAFSPDGNKIVFASDRGGQDNLWVMNADGSDARILHTALGERYTDPAWSPDGKTIVAVRNLPSPARGWHRRTWALVTIPAEGGTPTNLLAGEYDQYYAPRYSPDGRYVYFHSAIMAYRAVSVFQYRQKLKRVELATGKVETIVSPEPPDQTRDASAPSWAMHLASYIIDWKPAEMEAHPDPSGRYIAYAKEMPEADYFYRRHHVKGTTALMLYDLQTRTERVLVDQITRDLSRSHAYYVDTQMPGHDWTPDGKAVVFARHGKFFKVDIATNEITPVPFEARVHRTMSELVTPKFDVSNAANFKPRFYHWPALSPDKRTLVFGAAGRLWQQATTGGSAATPLLADRPFGGAAQFSPTWSDDGSKVAFVTWDDEKLGTVEVLDVKSGKVTNRCAANDAFIHLRWEKSGTLVVTARSVQPTEASPWDEGRWEARRINSATCAQTTIASLSHVQPVNVLANGRLSFVKPVVPSGVRFINEPFPPPEAYQRYLSVVSVAPDGSGEQVHTRFPYRGGVGNRPSLSPGGDMVLFEGGYRLFNQNLSAVEKDANVVITPSEEVPGRTRLDEMGVSDMLYFSADEVQFTSADNFILANVRTGEKTVVPFRLTIPNELPAGRLALTNATIITMEGNQVIDKGTVVVEKGRIVCVGKCSTRSNDTVMDMFGKTIIPGLIDMHEHTVRGEGSDLGVAMQHHSLSSLVLAYGITTIRDPSGGKVNHPFMRDLAESRYNLGPRTFGTGQSVTEDGFSGRADSVRIEDMDDARFHVDVRRAVGVESLKNFRLTNRKQHQFLIEAAREKNMAVTAEGASPILALGFTLDGQTGWEHTTSALPMFKDLTTFFGMAGVTHSPTLNVLGYPDPTQTYYRGYQNIPDDPVYTRFASGRMIKEREARTPAPLPKDRFWNPIYAESTADIVRAGGYVTTGEHGEQPGYGTHWEIWGFAEAMTPMEALGTATTAGAYFFGASDQIGSIKEGKLADLVVLNANPLRNIHFTTDIAYVMAGGRLLERATLDQVWPAKKEFGFRPWSRDPFKKGEKDDKPAQH